MQFEIKRDILLKSLNFVQGVVEKKKYASNFVKCFTTIKKQKINNCSNRFRCNFLR